MLGDGARPADGTSEGGLILVSSASVTRIARLLAPLAGTFAMAAMALLSMVCLLVGASRVDLSFGALRWLERASLADVLLASLAFAFCVLVHEIGHAAACHAQTGIVGCVRARFYRGIPVFTNDVSSLALATPTGRAAP